MVIKNYPGKCRQNLEVKKTLLYYPNESDWSYCHHGCLAYYNGMFFAAWSNGEKDEDDIGQRIMMSKSCDGERWSAPEIVVDSIMGEYHHAVLSACGMYVNDDSLVLYAGYYEYDKDNVSEGKYIDINTMHKNTTLLAYKTVNGVDWTGPKDMKIPLVANHGPAKLASGRLLISGNFAQAFTDDISGLSDWCIGMLPGSEWPGWFDDAEGHEIAAKVRGDDFMLCEGSFFQEEDGTVNMLLRSNKKRLYHTKSCDGGASWSKAVPTEFTDCGTKFHCGRLDDGRYYIVGSPDASQPRCPLVISVSDDGFDYDREYVIENINTPQRIKGKYKGGVYGYPHSIIKGSTMYVVCSIHKEDMVVFSLDINQLK